MTSLQADKIEPTPAELEVAHLLAGVLRLSGLNRQSRMRVLAILGSADLQ